MAPRVSCANSRMFGRMLITAILLLLVVLPFIANTYVVHMAIFTAINLIAVIGLGLLGGFAGQVSLGQAGFYGIGAYASALVALRLGWPVVVAIAIGTVFAGVCGVLVAVPTLRVSDLYLVMVTLGFGVIAWLVFIGWQSLTRGTQGLLDIPSPSIVGFGLDNRQRYWYLALALAALTVWFARRLSNSPLGLCFKALSDEPLAARAVGVETLRLKVLAFGIAAGLAGLAGALYAHYIGFIHPDNFTLPISINFLVMMVFGGKRSLVGMVVSTALLTVGFEYLRQTAQLREILYGLLLVVGIIYLPNGIGSIGPQLRDSWTRRRLSFATQRDRRRG